jgi:glycosyltransferase involved in cell wall biosynthesis
MKNKNIWIISQYAGSPLHGMVFRSYYLAKNFVIKGYNTTVITASYSHVRKENPEKITRNKIEHIDGVKYYWVKIRKYQGSKSIGRIFSLLEFPFKLFFLNKKELSRPDVIIVSSASPLPIINGWLWSKKYNAKLIFEVRDLWPLTLIELGNVTKYNPFVILLQLAENFACRVSDNIVSVLKNSKEYFISHGMTPEKFIYIPNGVEIEKSDKNIDLKNIISDKHLSGKFIIGYAGTLGIANAMEFLIEASNKLKNYNDIHFLIIGDGGEKDKLIKMTQNYSLNNITFLNSVPKAAVPSLLELMDVTYIAGRKEKIYEYGISPNKIFDYMLSRKPILISIDSEFDLVTEAGCGLKVSPEDPDDIADGILALYNMTKKERNTLGKNGENFVKSNHLYSHLAEQYIQLF